MEKQFSSKSRESLTHFVQFITVTGKGADKVSPVFSDFTFYVTVLNNLWSSDFFLKVLVYESMLSNHLLRKQFLFTPLLHNKRENVNI